MRKAVDQCVEIWSRNEVIVAVNELFLRLTVRSVWNHTRLWVLITNIYREENSVSLYLDSSLTF